MITTYHTGHKVIRAHNDQNRDIILIKKVFLLGPTLSHVGERIAMSISVRLSVCMFVCRPMSAIAIIYP